MTDGDLPAELTPGERIRDMRERRGMSRPVLAGLVGRSADWLKKIENGDREIRSLPMLIRLAEVLRVGDLSQLTGSDMPMPVDAWGKLSHPGVTRLREAMHFSLLRSSDVEPTNVDELAGRVRQAWTTWHSSTHQRSEVAALLPPLLTDCHSVARSSEGADRRRAFATMAEAYALAQQYAAHTTEPELYWLTVDRARMAAEQSDDPVALAAAAWIVGNGLRESGHTEEALRLVSEAVDSLRPRLDSGPHILRGTYGALCLHAAITSAKEGREGDAWRWWDEADRTAKRMPDYAHPWTMFGRGNVSVHAVSIGVDLRTPGAALKQAEATVPESIPSVERRSRLYLDAARAQWARKEHSGALQYLNVAFKLSPEAVRYVPSGRALAQDLARKSTGALRAEAVALAEAVGVAP
ncbi:helix-turn-helix domain-containing protein [Streptomyces litchfieldiae]|uniref:Helix-turn-helix transcriptional regulator n=1 Tax=Streptomyces litchfieldiae TaxID=3075543 RepID=A0ABU2MP30_9ACTN|nr:helix-turn-helix transcriptional regulator [Streptomyces sp. DSM 44938]MDT0343216.1 helix-turn-helix transcriptional regulator [Streptomyces sp. DSM 44938]